MNLLQYSFALCGSSFISKSLHKLPPACCFSFCRPSYDRCWTILFWEYASSSLSLIFTWSISVLLSPPIESVRYRGWFLARFRFLDSLHTNTLLSSYSSSFNAPLISSVIRQPETSDNCITAVCISFKLLNWCKTVFSSMLFAIQLHLNCTGCLGRSQEFFTSAIHRFADQPYYCSL